MRFVPDSYGADLRESNGCHGADGRFCSSPGRLAAKKYNRDTRDAMAKDYRALQKRGYAFSRAKGEAGPGRFVGTKQIGKGSRVAVRVGTTTKATTWKKTSNWAGKRSWSSQRHDIPMRLQRARESQADLAKRYGIERFEFAKPDHAIKTIGYSPRTKTWYGWSHRAVAGFKIGSVVKKGDVVATAGPDEDRVSMGPFPIGFVAKTDDDARALAAAFAEGVS